MSLSLEVYGTKVLVSPDIQPEMTKGGIVIPETSRASKAETVTGTIIKKGDLVEVYDIGDRVFYSPYAGQLIKLKGAEYQLLTEESVLAKIVGNED